MNSNINALLQQDAPPREVRVEVAVPAPVGALFSYALPEEYASLEPGTLVQVPFGRQHLWGVVWLPKEEETLLPPDVVLKSIEQVHGGEKLPRTSLSFVEWVARYTMTPLGMVLKMALYPKALLQPKPSSCRSLAVQGKETLPREVPPVILGEDQGRAATALRALVKTPKFQVTLLDGVTGSGKTEVYFEAIQQALAQDLQVLVLLPEIALSTQWVQRFEERFGVFPLEWHSAVTPARKREVWQAMIQGKKGVVVGARSALFLPFQTLGLIVVDEEHDASFKQEEGVIYHARDMAIVRARIHDAPIVLASATPSLETLTNALQGRYQHLKLPSRHGGATLPEIQMVDLRQDKAKPSWVGGEKGWISGMLDEAIRETLSQGQQGLLFLNRRGFAPLTLCRKCGHRLQCPYCSVTLVDHRRRLLCHQCGHRASKPELCPACHEEETLIPWGPGVERLADEVAHRYPSARVAVISSDAVSGQAAVRQLIQTIQNREIDLLIGTQMIAKGYHFPQLTLVGVIDADSGLSGGDPRASERTFQLLHQVAGRSGRGQEKGRVFLQTHMPDHPVMSALAAGDRDLFFQLESQERRQYGLPPYGRLAALVISGKNALTVESAARNLGKVLPSHSQVEVWGPAPAPLSLVRGNYRWRLLVKSSGSSQVFLQAWLARWQCPAGVRVQLDIDPYNFM